MTNNEHILLFDGECNMCNRLVRFTAGRDRKSKIRYISLQSEEGRSLLEINGLSSRNLDTAVYIRGGRYFLRSSAILNVLKDLGGIWQLFFAFRIIPEFIRDLIYRILAKNRNRFFRCKKYCTELG